ncbi:MAG: prolipoprotein diacylglyceryl transferase [Candidatus Hydrogenedentota bacterium]|nr:MAG: prolipoprotein diacylglyceryl transferase [Candidatus Hydrogenedentota bacterium]
MYPILFSIGGFPIHTYGVLVALGFAVGLATAVSLGRREGIDADTIGDLALVALLSGLVGGRLLYVIVEWDQFRDHLASIVLRRDGFVFFGGLLLAAPAVLFTIRRKNLPLGKTADVFAPAIALGHSIGRIGCFSQGCCFGRPFKFGIRFPTDAPASLAYGHVPVHPTQLYESISLLILFFFLLRYHGKRRFEGETFLVYAASYSVIRFIIEFFRGDDRGFFLGPISISQIISSLLFAAAIVLIFRCRKRASSS